MTALTATYDPDCNAEAADDELREETTTLHPPQDPFLRRYCALIRSASMTALNENEASYDLDCDAAAADDDDDALKSYYVQGIVGDAIRARLVVKDKLLRKKSCCEEGSQGQYTLNRGNSCPDLGSSLDDDAAVETQASSLPAVKIGAGFFKSYAQHIKNQRAKLSGAQTS